MSQFKTLSEYQQLERERAKQQSLPHLYRHKFYKWQREFWQSTNRMTLLTAANQIGKSSIQIRKAIHWATHKRLWKSLWPLKIIDNSDVPHVFWYLYPDKNVATSEFYAKWVPEFLPKGDMKNDPVYGWKMVLDRKKVDYIKFNSGVHLYFKTYKQDAASLQANTVYAVFCDEELPFELYDEVKMRLSNTEGYFSMVFTATLNQIQWKEAIEYRDHPRERFKNATKIQVSLFDCMTFEDGSPSYWTRERIKNRIDDCGSDIEVQRRIYGKFVTEEGLKYDKFDSERHYVQPYDIPEDYLWFAGVDVGSGGKRGHPSAIVFVAASANFDECIVAYGWRGDGIDTTAGDVVEKYLNMELELGLKGKVHQVCYDFACKDFLTIAERVGLSVIPANKSHSHGEGVMNTLFAHDGIKIFDKPELVGLGEELATIMRNTAKNKAVDDFADALRYCIASVSWNWDSIKPKTKQVKKVFDPVEDEFNRRRGIYEGDREPGNEIIEELNLWNDLLN